MERQADFGGFLGETFAIVRDSIRAVAIFVVVLGGVTAAGVSLGLANPEYASFNFGLLIDNGRGVSAALFEIASLIVTIIATYFLLSAYLAQRGRVVDGYKRLLPFVGLYILWSLGVILGFFLLIIPGLILLARWSAAQGFLLGSGSGVIESFGRSWQATKGYAWPVFFAGLVLFLIVTVIGGAVGGVIGAALASTNALAIVGIASGLAEAISGALFAAFSIAVYCLLDRDHDQLGEVFS